MSLQNFLNANPIDNLTEEVVVSDRFKTEKGEILKFKVKALTNDEFETARKASTTIRKGGKVEFNAQEFNSQIVIKNTIEPNFKDAESISKLGCRTPLEYLSKVLLAGEIVQLAEEIQNISGFKAMDDLVEEAKN